MRLLERRGKLAMRELRLAGRMRLREVLEMACGIERRPRAPGVRLEGLTRSVDGCLGDLIRS